MKPYVIVSLAGLAAVVSTILVLRGVPSGGRPVSDSEVPASERLEILGTVPDFTLTDQDGQEFGLRQLAGKVWVANFIFSRCPGTCPLQTLSMSKLQQSLVSQPQWCDIRLVSFSVDPEYDTPAVLAAYARQAGAEANHWHFLTGPRDAIWQVSTSGFKLDVGEAPPDAASPLFHSPNSVLVDRQGRIRGYYDGMSEVGVELTRTALLRLLEQEG